MPAQNHAKFIEDLKKEYPENLATFRADEAIKKISSLGFVIAVDPSDAKNRRSKDFKENSYFILNVYCENNPTDPIKKIQFHIDKDNKFHLAGHGKPFDSLPKLLEHYAHELEQNKSISKDSLFWKKVVPPKKELQQPKEMKQVQQPSEVLQPEEIKEVHQPFQAPELEEKEEARSLVNEDSKLGSFFSRWYLLQNEGLSSQKITLYMYLCESSPLSNEKIQAFITASKINLPKGVDQGLDQPAIDQMFVHAICFDPESWSKEFTQHFRQTLAFLMNSTFKGKDANLMKTSYLPSLLQQLQYLENHRQIWEWEQNKLAGEQKAERPKELPRPSPMILLPHQVQTRAECKTVSGWLDKARKALFLKDLEKRPYHYLKMILKEENYKTRLAAIQKADDASLQDALLLLQRDFPSPTEEELGQALLQLFVSDQRISTQKEGLVLGETLQFELDLPASVSSKREELLKTAQAKLEELRRIEQEKKAAEVKKTVDGWIVQEAFLARVEQSAGQRRAAAPQAVVQQNIVSQAVGQQEQQGSMVEKKSVEPSPSMSQQAALEQQAQVLRNSLGVGNKTVPQAPVQSSGTLRWKWALGVVGIIVGGALLATGIGSIAMLTLGALFLSCGAGYLIYTACKAGYSRRTRAEATGSDKPVSSNLPPVSTSLPSQQPQPSPRSGGGSPPPLTPSSVTNVSVCRSFNSRPGAESKAANSQPDAPKSKTSDVKQGPRTKI